MPAPPPSPPPPSGVHSSSSSLLPSNPTSKNLLANEETEKTHYKSNDVTISAWNGDHPDTTEFEFPRLEERKGSVSLRTVDTQYAGSLQSRKVSAEKLFQILGRLRCLQYAIERYNSGLLFQTHEFLRYWRRHTLGLLSGFGFRPNAESETIQIDGLPELISQVELFFRQTLQAAQKSIASGMITFDGLGELFKPDIPVKCTAVPGSPLYTVWQIASIRSAVHSLDHRNTFMSLWRSLF